MNTNDVVVIGGVADDPFAIDVAHNLGQRADISDLVSYKTFANSEFCPRFISDERDMDNIGNLLVGKTVVIISTCCGEHTRNARAMRNCLLTRAAKDNGAREVILVEPDLFFSAQDRGPRGEHGNVAFKRTTKDYKKFDGQPFSSLLYAQLLKTSGVDGVVTVHNHSVSVQDLFQEVFKGRFFNLTPATLYAHYLSQNEFLDPIGQNGGLLVCAPDKGAAPFVEEVFAVLQQNAQKRLISRHPGLLLMDKSRTGERQVEIVAQPHSPVSLDEIEGKDVVVFDDMVRTGSTITECCRQLKAAKARRVLFVVTHFYSSDEVKANLNDHAIDEIVTTNTLPTILNRDMQGRLRRKMLVLKIEKWIASAVGRDFFQAPPLPDPLYTLDISSKNPRWKHYQK